MRLRERLDEPKVEDFQFNLLPGSESMEDYEWHFGKDLRELFVTARSDRSGE